MAAAVIPIVELGLQEIPVLVPEILKVINSVKSVIHKPAGATFTPQQVAAAQTAALAMAKPVVAAALPTGSASLTDAQLQTFIEAIYQMQKAVPATVPAAATSSTSGSPALQALQTVTAFAALAQTVIAEIQQGVRPATA